MATLTLEIGNGDRDAFESAAGAVTTNGANINLNAGGQWAGLGFRDVAGDLLGATINSAKLRLYVINTSGDDPVLDVYLQKTYHSVDYTTTTGDVSNRTRTTNKASVNASSVGAGWYEITGLGPAVAEVVALSGWSGERELFPILDPLSGCNLNIRTYDYDPALAAELVIDYTPSGGGITPSSIATAESVPSATVSPGAVSVLPSSIATAEAIGAAVVGQAGANALFDAVSTTTSTVNTTSLSLNHTASGSNRVAVVIVHLMRNASGGIAITAATYGGNAMTERATIEYDDTTRSKTYRISIYTFTAPPTSSTAVAITTNQNSIASAVTVLSYTGVDQSTPYDAGGTAQIVNSSAPTVNVTTTVANALIVGGLHLRGGDTDPFTPGTGVTERYDLESGTDTTGDIGATGGERAVTSTGTYAFAATAAVADWGVIAAIALKPVAVTPPQTVTPDGVASVESLPNPTLGVGAVAVAPPSVGTIESVPGPVLSAGAVTVAPSAGVASAESVPGPSLAQVTAVAPSGITSAESVPGPVIGRGPVTIAPAGIGTAESVPQPTIGRGAVTVTPGSIATAESVPLPTVAGAGVYPDSIPTAGAFGAATVAPGAVAVAPSGIVSAENVNGVSVGRGAVTVAPGSIGSGQSVPNPVVSSNRIVLTMTSGSNDSREDNDGFIYLTQTESSVNAASPYVGFYWPNLPVPAGATVLHAYQRLYTTTLDDPALTAYAAKNTSPAALSATAGDLSGRAATDTTVPWVASSIGRGEYNDSPDLAPIVQEFIGLPGYVEGQSDFLLIFHDNGAGGRIRFNMADNATDRPQLVLDFVVGAAAQTVTPGGIASGEAVGAATLSPGPAAVDVAEGIPTAESVPDVALIIAQAIVDAGEIGTGWNPGDATVTQGGPVVTVDDGAASAESVPMPSLLGVTLIEADAVGSAENVPSPALLYDLTVEPDGIASAGSVPSPTLAAGVVIVTAGGIASLEAFGIPAATMPQTVAPAGVASAESVPQPALTPGAVVVVVAGGIASAESVGAAVVSVGTLVVSPDGIQTLETFGVPLVAVGAVAIAAGSVPSGEAIGATTVQPAAWPIAPDSVPTAENVGQPAIAPGAATVAPGGVASLEAFGAALLSAFYTVAADSAPSTESVPSPEIMMGGVSVAPAGIPTAESVGAAVLAPGSITVAADAVASLEAFGGAALVVGGVTIRPPGIGSAEIFGLLLLTARFLPTLNIRRMPFKSRVYAVDGEGQVYAVPFKARVYRIED